MKTNIPPAVFVGLAIAALGLVLFLGFRSVNSTPKLDYPPGFNPAKPPGAAMGNAAAKPDAPRPGNR
jgi:hypothetical protein